MFRSYCRLWLWLNPSVVWHFLFLSPIARFAHFLSLSFSGRGPPTPFRGTLSSLVCVKPKSSRKCLINHLCCEPRGRASEQHFKRGSFCRCGIRGLVHTEALPHSHSSPHPSALWWRFFSPPPPSVLRCILGPFELLSQKNVTLIALFIRRSYDQIPEEAKFLSNNLYL